MTARELKTLALYTFALAAWLYLSSCNALVRTGIKLKVDILGVKASFAMPIESIPVELFRDGGTYRDSAD